MLEQIAYWYTICMSTIYIDVREPFEYQSDHVKGAINIPLGTLQQKIPSQLEHIAKDATIVVYCRTGNRSGLAVPYMQHYGFINVTNGINKATIESARV